MCPQGCKLYNGGACFWQRIYKTPPGVFNRLEQRTIPSLIKLAYKRSSGVSVWDPLKLFQGKGPFCYRDSSFGSSLACAPLLQLAAQQGLSDAFLGLKASFLGGRTVTLSFGEDGGSKRETGEELRQQFDDFYSSVQRLLFFYLCFVIRLADVCVFNWGSCDNIVGF